MASFVAVKQGDQSTCGGTGWAGLWAALLIAVALSQGVRTTGDLVWPNEHDFYREMASAQSLLTEGFGHDPLYPGETVWYNPLTHVAFAAVQHLTGLPLEIVVSRSGAYLNLIGPVCFFLLVAVLFDAWTAVLALTGFLFCVGGSFSSWMSATYSPWLYPVNFAQGFFYLLMILLASLRGRWPGARWALLAGLVWGVTFLAHTAPAVLFALVLFCLLVAPALRHLRAWPTGLRPVAVPALLMAAVFVAVIFPFARSLVGHYGLHVLNPIPIGFVDESLGYRNIPEMIRRHLELPVLAAWLGLYLVLKGQAEKHTRHLLLAWFGVSAAFVVYGYVAVGALKVGVHLPAIVPSYHFLFYMKAALAVFFAVGVTALARAAVTRLARRHPLAVEPWTRRVALALALGLAVWNLPGYESRYDFSRARAEALGHGGERDRIAVFHWVRGHAATGEVFLASDDLALFGLAPAGAKVVVVDPYLSSPYVDWTSRNEARNRMFALLGQGDFAAFAALARAYRVAYVAADRTTGAIAPALLGSGLQEVFASGPIHLYRVHSP